MHTMRTLIRLRGRADAQSDLSLRWASMLKVTFSHNAAPFTFQSTQLNVTIPCKSSTTSGKCGNFTANPCDCHTQGWHMEVEFGTVGWNLYNVFTVGAGNNASLVRRGNIVELE